MSVLRRTLIGSSLAASAAASFQYARAAPGNVLRIGIGSSLNTLDPMMTTIGDEYIYDNLAFNGLTRMREDLVVEPDLAESWSPSADLKEWTFKLRRDVKFHDGQSLVADDVVAFFKRLLDPANSAPTRSQCDMIESVSASDASTVTFKLSIPYGGFADILTDRQTKITPRGAAAQMATKPVGTGPFKFISYTPGDRLVLAANPDYFEGAPKLAGVELRIIPEMSVKIAALQAGDIDIVWDLPLDQVKTLSASATLRVDSVPTSSWDGAIMNNLIPPFNDKRVRQAFHLAVDKKDVVELTLFGQGVETISPIAPSHPYYAKDAVVPKTDPVAARKLLAEAGLGGGVKVPIIVPVGRPVRERLGVTLQQLTKAAGFDLQVQRVPYSSFAAEVSGKAPLYIDGFFSRPTIDTSLFAFLRTNGSWNERLWHYSDETVDKALDAARLSADPAVQKKNYIDMQVALVANPASFFAYSVNYACAYRKGVANVKTHPMRWFDLRTATVS
jgi:peptide/nickel transport system substrate-binding protein